MSEPPVPPPPPSSYPPPPPPAGVPPSGTASSNRSLMIVLSYLWILFLVPLLVEKDDAEVQWHAKHGLVLTVAEFILWIVVVFLSSGIGPLPDLGCAGCFVRSALSAGMLAVRILAIVKGVNGGRFIIPGVSQYADRF